MKQYSKAIAAIVGGLGIIGSIAADLNAAIPALIAVVEAFAVYQAKNEDE